MSVLAQFVRPLRTGLEVSLTRFSSAGVCKTEEEEGPSTEEDSQSFHGVGVCKWFNVRMGFGFLSMTKREGVPLDEPVDVFVHQVSSDPTPCARAPLPAHIQMVKSLEGHYIKSVVITTQ